MRHSIDDDGLLRRFQVTVWPEISPDFEIIDRDPDLDAKERAYWIFKRCSELKGEDIGAEQRFDNPPALRFCPDAQTLFNDWIAKLEVRAGFDASSFESHMSKYRGLMPSLALIFHVVAVVAGDTKGPVSLKAAQLAAGWCDYLERHARKIYAPELNCDVAAAHALASRIKAGEIENGETVRNLCRHHWEGLGSIDAVRAGLTLLQEHGRLRIESQSSGGRPTEIVCLNPAA